MSDITVKVVGEIKFTEGEQKTVVIALPSDTKHVWTSEYIHVIGEQLSQAHPSIKDPNSGHQIMITLDGVSVHDKR